MYSLQFQELQIFLHVERDREVMGCSLRGLWLATKWELEMESVHRRVPIIMGMLITANLSQTVLFQKQSSKCLWEFTSRV